MAVVVVESPAKAKTINTYLGSAFTVLASYGHVRDLNDKTGSVDPNNNFSMKWQINPKSTKYISEIKSALVKDNHLILATDPDREGEAISWHLVEILRKQKSVTNDTKIQRIVFNAITKSAVLEAINNPRNLDVPLIEAYLARRALDYLLGYNLSPSLMKVGFGFQSAGRVQSPTLRLIVEREMEIESFKPQEYWSINVMLNYEKTKNFQAKGIEYKNKKIEKLTINTEKMANEIVGEFQSSTFYIHDVSSIPKKRKPLPPFLTSTLQQEANNRLYMGTQQTMSVAQKLYEAGYITYMRTDGIDMAPEAVSATRNTIKAIYGIKYLPGKPRFYKNKVANAQEAHECIRPTDISKNAENLNLQDMYQKKLYELIRNRALASQMEDEISETTTVILKNETKINSLKAIGRVIISEGFRKAFSYDESEDANSNENKELPILEKGKEVYVEKVIPQQHFTQAKPRYSEASLIKKMVDLGIGRPSTYASTVSSIQSRQYVRKEKNRLIPEDKGKLISIFLTEYFKKYVGYDYTAELEVELDNISSGKSEWVGILTKFWREFFPTLEIANDLRISEVLERINHILTPHIFPDTDDKKDPRLCQNCNDGKLSIRTSRSGSAFIGCSNYPECKFVRPFGVMTAESLNEKSNDDSIGVDNNGEEIFLKSGRFGPYVQLGDSSEQNPKPKRTSIPKNFETNKVTIEIAKKLLDLPKVLGKHPEDNEPIHCAIGPYGPYIKHINTYANIKDLEEFLSIGMNRAVELLSENSKKKINSKGAASVIRVIGIHPEGGDIQLMNGRFGPYIKYKKNNVSIKNKDKLEEIDLKTALELINNKKKK
ncbi:MAG: type I DNA topoisomerase [Paracoccaceae bacterium]